MMEVPSMAKDPLVIGTGVILLLASLTIWIVCQKQKATVLCRLHFQHRRASGSKTSPRPFSPVREKPTRYTERGALLFHSAQDLLNSFPPSRRSSLAKVTEHAAASGKQVVIGPEPTASILRYEALPTTQSNDLGNQILKYTPTGFSTADIKAIGDFPPYDVLTGVPLPDVYEGFDHKKALPRPYRPFRWPYHQTMSLTKMEPNWWLEVERTYLSRISERRRLYDEHGTKVLDYLPGSNFACKELMEMCLQFYCTRYPALFSLSGDKRTFHNRLLGQNTDIRSMHPLHVLLHNIPEDFAIVLRNEIDGLYYFRAGVICSSLGWNVSTKIGMALKDIHKPIPDYREKMAFSMDRYFTKMPTDAPIQRGSWGLEIGTPLFMPPGHPHEKLREVQMGNLSVEDCNLRVDWQTLRRLPVSGGISFNFKALFTPVTEFRDEPYIPALLVKILKEGKKSLMEYKSTWHVEHVCIPALEAYAEDQKRKGWVIPENPGEDGWNVSTLSESPFFPGWRRKWHRQQGFQD